MSALVDARAALADLRAGIPQRGDYPEYDREHEDLDKIAALIAEHERQLQAFDGYAATIRAAEARAERAEAEVARLTAPPTDDEREALVSKALRTLMLDPAVPTGVRPHLVDGEVLVIRERCDAEPIVWAIMHELGFRRQGPITDAQVQAAFDSWNGMHVGTVRDRLRAALEAAERAR